MMPTLVGDLVSSSASLPVSAQSSLSAENLPPDAFVALLLAQLSGDSGASGTELGAAIAALTGSTVVDDATLAASSATGAVVSADAPATDTPAGDTPAAAGGAAATAQHGADPQPLLVDTAALLALMGLQQVVNVPASGNSSSEAAAATPTGAVEAVSASATSAAATIVPPVADPSSAALAVPSETQSAVVDGKLVPAADAVVDEAMELPTVAQPAPTQAASLGPVGSAAGPGMQGVVAQAAEPASVAAVAVALQGAQPGKPGRAAGDIAQPASKPAQPQSVQAVVVPASATHTMPAEQSGAQRAQPEAIVSGPGGAAQPSALAEKHESQGPAPVPVLAVDAKTAAVPAKPAAAPMQEPAASFWRELARPITNQTAAGVRMALAQGGKEAHIRLQPESLGHLDIRIVLDGNNAQIHVMAEHAEVGQVIASHWTQLRETLATQGLQATNLAVSVGLGGNPRELAGRNARHDEWQRDREGVTGIQDEGLDVTQSRPTMSASRHFLDGGRIEYWG